jgi:hypothetical protein
MTTGIKNVVNQNPEQLAGDNIDANLHQADALRQNILKKAFEDRLLGKAELKACRNEPDRCSARELVAKIKTTKSKK